MRRSECELHGGSGIAIQRIVPDPARDRRVERHPALLQVRSGDSGDEPGADHVLLVERGWANYNAGFLSYRTRNYKGLTVDANVTWAHSLDTRGLNQDFDTAASNSYDLHYDYGTSIFDRKIVFNLLSFYELPFGKRGHGPLNYIVRDWSIAPIVNISSGLPLKVLTGSTQEFGQGGGSNSGGAILTQPNTFGNEIHSGVAGNAANQVGINGDPARGGTGSEPVRRSLRRCFGAFRPAMVSLDTTSGAEDSCAACRGGIWT